VQAVALGSADIRATVVLDGTAGVSRVTVRTTQLTALVAGEDFTCGIDRDSTAACWGDGLFGSSEPACARAWRHRSSSLRDVTSGNWRRDALIPAG